MARKSKKGTHKRSHRKASTNAQSTRSAASNPTTPSSVATAPSALSATAASTLNFIRDVTLHGINFFGTGLSYFWMNVEGAVKMAESTAGAASLLSFFGYASIRVNMTLNLLAMRKIISLINEMQKSFSQVRKTASPKQFTAYSTMLLTSIIGILYLSVPSAGAPVQTLVKGFDAFFSEGPFLETDIAFGEGGAGVTLGTIPAWGYIGQNSIALFALSVIRAVFDKLNEWFMAEKDLKVKTEIGSAISALETFISDLKVASPEEMMEMIGSLRSFIGELPEAEASDSALPTTAAIKGAPLMPSAAVDDRASDVESFGTPEFPDTAPESFKTLIAEMKDDLVLAGASSSELAVILGWLTGAFYWSGTSPDIIPAAENEAQLGKISVIIKWLCGNGVPTPFIASLFNATQGIFSSRYAVEGANKLFDSLYDIIQRDLGDPIAVTKVIALLYALGTLGPTIGQIFLGDSEITAEKLLGTANTLFVNSSVTDVIAVQDVSFFQSWGRDGFLYASGLHRVASCFGLHSVPSAETRLRETAIAVVNELINGLKAMPYDGARVPAQLDAAISRIKTSEAYYAFDRVYKDYTALANREGSGAGAGIEGGAGAAAVRLNSDGYAPLSEGLEA